LSSIKNARRIVDRRLLSQLYEFMDEELKRSCLGKSYEDTITCAFRIVEERLRKRINASAELYALSLIDAAFHPENGKLVFGETQAEKQAVHQVFRSAYMMFRNPPSHRYLEEYGDAEVAEIVVFVDFLLKVLSKSSERKVRCRICDKLIPILSQFCPFCGSTRDDALAYLERSSTDH
jgi:uncharacterized protein (TIGR02391 family)